MYNYSRTKADEKHTVKTTPISKFTQLEKIEDPAQVQQVIHDLTPLKEKSIQDVILSFYKNPQQGTPVARALRAHYQTQGKLKALLSDRTQPLSEINLSIIETHKIKNDKLGIDEKDNKRDEKNVDVKQALSNPALQHYEEEYNVKGPIAVKDIFDLRQEDAKLIKRLLILGRSGIGKSIMTKFFAYQWSRGELWNQHFDYVFWIPLQRLSAYKDKGNLQLEEVIHQICFMPQQRVQITLQELQQVVQHHSERTLWLLDGYDEVAHLVGREELVIGDILQQLLSMEYIVLTSRPYHLSNTDSFDRHLENMGFTDLDIESYVRQYFSSLPEEKSVQQKLRADCLAFLKNNPSLWGTVHVPINLALVTEIWQDIQAKQLNNSRLNRRDDITDQKTSAIINNSIGRKHFDAVREEKATNTGVSLTQLYQDIVYFTVKRCLEKEQKESTRNKLETWIYEQRKIEIAFLEQLAFKGLTTKTSGVNIEPNLQKDVLKNLECLATNDKESKREGLTSLFDRVLQLGFLKTVGVDEREEINKAHYFIHLTFQEFFAARYVITQLKQSQGDLYQQAILFIRHEKYNPRYQTLFTFIAGILSVDKENVSTMRIFWNTLLCPPLDLIGVSHLRLIIYCLEEAQCDPRIPFYNSMMRDIERIFVAQMTVTECDHKQFEWFYTLLNNCSLVLDSARCVEMAFKTTKDTKMKMVLIKELLSRFDGKEVINKVTMVLLNILNDPDKGVRRLAVSTLPGLGEKIVNHEVIQVLLKMLNDQDRIVRNNVILTLGKFGEKAAIREVIQALVKILSDPDQNARCLAAKALAGFGEKAAVLEVGQALLKMINDQSEFVQRAAAITLGQLGKKAVTNEIIQALQKARGDQNWYIRYAAAIALGKVSEIVATNDVIESLLKALNDPVFDVRSAAAESLVQHCEKNMIPTITQALLKMLDAQDDRNGRRAAVNALGKLCENAVTSDVLEALLRSLNDVDQSVQINAALILSKIGEKAATFEVIQALLEVIGNYQDLKVRNAVTTSLCQLSTRVATNKIIPILLQALNTQNQYIRYAAVEVINRLAEKAATPEIIQILLDIQDNRNKSDRNILYATTKALGQLSKKIVFQEKVIKALLKGLHDEDLFIRGVTVEALGQFGEKAAIREVIQALQKVLLDQNVYIRNIAAKALEQLGEKAAIPDVFQTLVKWKNMNVFPLSCWVNFYCQVVDPFLLRRLAEQISELCFYQKATVIFDEQKLIQWQGGKKMVWQLPPLLKSILVEAFAAFVKAKKLPYSYLSYYIPIEDWGIVQNQNQLYPFDRFTKFVNQAVKIQLNYLHKDCKEDVFKFFSKALSICDEPLQYLDLSNNQLTDAMVPTLMQSVKKWQNLRTLKLSHNHITVTGLQYLLKGLNSESSINFLFLDHNLISFDAQFCEKILEPKIKQSQLEVLDLSMNFICKGELLDEKGMSSSNSRIVFDKLTMKQKLTEERRLYVKRFFANSPNVKSVCSPEISSLLDEKLTIDTAHGVIALLANKTSAGSFAGEHAYLALEGVHKFGQRYIITGDLFFDPKTNRASIIVKHCTPQQYLERTQEGERVHSRVALVTKANLKLALQELLKSRNQQAFIDYKALPGKGEHNCLTWAVAMLNKIGIELSPNSVIPSRVVNHDKSICLVM